MSASDSWLVGRGRQVKDGKPRDPLFLWRRQYKYGKQLSNEGMCNRKQ